mgnify:CR=1 FL=1|tara:strand:- start:11769 stop:12014 length:246 start_codon:yes stop_codon:yes gene_type:complete
MIKHVRDVVNNHSMLISVLKFVVPLLLVGIFTWLFTLDSRVDAMPDKYIAKEDFKWVISEFTRAVDKRVEALEHLIIQRNN